MNTAVFNISGEHSTQIEYSHKNRILEDPGKAGGLNLIQSEAVRALTLEEVNQIAAAKMKAQQMAKSAPAVQPAQTVTVEAPARKRVAIQEEIQPVESHAVSGPAQVETGFQWVQDHSWDPTPALSREKTEILNQVYALFAEQGLEHRQILQEMMAQATADERPAVQMYCNLAMG